MRNNMRTSFLAGFFSLSLVACTGVIGDPGPGGDDDDVPGPDCGDAVINAGETCDDGNNVSGDGCSAACSVEASPALSMTVDNTQVMTELMTETMMTLTFTASGGFAGPVNLTGAAVNAQNAPIAGWTITFDQATVNVPQDGTASAVATVKIPAENMGLAGTIKFDGASSLGTQSTTSAVTVLNQVSIPMTLKDNGGCVPPTNTQFTVSTGTKVRWVNKSADGIQIHINEPNTLGFSHQGSPSAPNGVYEQTVTGDSGTVAWYCHDREGDQGYRITAKPAP